MWDQYKRTFFRIQLLIAAVSCAVHIGTGYLWPRTLTFFAIMQIGAIGGAAWGTRIRRLRENGQTFFMTRQ
jgi:hypothetical protein